MRLSVYIDVWLGNGGVTCSSSDNVVWNFIIKSSKGVRCLVRTRVKSPRSVYILTGPWSCQVLAFLLERLLSLEVRRNFFFEQLWVTKLD